MRIRVVVQISELDRVRAALTSCKNLISELPDAEVEAVFHQSAIWAVVRGSMFEDEVKELMSRGMAVVACRNAMRSYGVKDEDLVENVKTVSAGVAEIVRRQAEGWAYLKL